MPLLDHFRPPLSARRPWHSFHNAWATYLAADLNARLPPGYFAAANVQFGIEIDVAAFEEDGAAPAPGGWQPAAPSLTVPLTVITDVAEVLIHQENGGTSLTGAIELVSPSNKDRASHREAFVSKCASYLQQGVGLMMIDVVTARRGNLHDALLPRVSTDPAVWGVDLYAVAYHPVGQNGQSTLELWPEELKLGRPLPELPLWLRGGLCLPLDLEATYTRTCQEQRVP